jgi:hypothetical protein
MNRANGAGGATSMPVARYFLFVGGVLLALLFALDAFAPQQVAVASNSAPSIDKTVVRIRSDQKLPERVVYDMSLPTIVPPAAKTQVAAAPVADLDAQARVRDTFAQFVPAEAKKLGKQLDPQAPRKRKVTRIAKSRSAQPPMRFAQQQQPPPQHFGFFGNTW